MLKSTSNGIHAVPYYAANLSYFTEVHAIYGTMAVIIISVLCLPPILLLLYPFSAFQVVLNKCISARWREAIRILFVEYHQGYLRNGLDGGRDCRYVAAWPFILQLLITDKNDNPFSPHFGGQIVAILLLIMAIGSALLRPYTKLYLTVPDTVLLGLMSIILLVNSVYLVLLDISNHKHMLGIIATLSVLPVVWWVGSIWGIGCCGRGGYCSLRIVV